MRKQIQSLHPAQFTRHATSMIIGGEERHGIGVLALKVCSWNFNLKRIADSLPALATYEPRIKAKADQLSAHIDKFLEQPLDMSVWSMFLSFDIMGDVGFGKEFDNLTTGIEHQAIKGVHDHMAVLGTLGHIPWLLYLVGRIPGAASGYSSFFKWCEDEIERKRKVRKISSYAWKFSKFPYIN